MISGRAAPSCFYRLRQAGGGLVVTSVTNVSGNTWRISFAPLTEDGTYTIRVYLMGNDRDTDKTVGYNVDISIQ